MAFDYLICVEKQVFLVLAEHTQTALLILDFLESVNNLNLKPERFVIFKLGFQTLHYRDKRLLVDGMIHLNLLFLI